MTKYIDAKSELRRAIDMLEAAETGHSTTEAKYVRAAKDAIDFAVQHIEKIAP